MKNRNIGSKIKRSKVTDYAALKQHVLLTADDIFGKNVCFESKSRFNKCIYVYIRNKSSVGLELERLKTIDADISPVIIRKLARFYFRKNSRK